MLLNCKVYSNFNELLKPNSTKFFIFIKKTYFTKNDHTFLSQYSFYQGFFFFWKIAFFSFEISDKIIKVTIKIQYLPEGGDLSNIKLN